MGKKNVFNKKVTIRCILECFLWLQYEKWSGGNQEQRQLYISAKLSYIEYNENQMQVNNKNKAELTVILCVNFCQPGCKNNQIWQELNPRKQS